MAYRNGTYVAFDGQGKKNPTESDIRYYMLLRQWNASSSYELQFSDSHQKTYAVLDSSSMQTLKSRLMDRMRNSKNMLLILSEDTNWDRGLLNFEIEQAVDYNKLPIIVAYTGYISIQNVNDELEIRWPKALKERIENNTAKCIHIPFKEKAIMSAISQFSVHNKPGENALSGARCMYTRQAYVDWGYIK